MATAPVSSTPASSNSSAAAARPAGSFHLPSYLLGVTTALVLLGAAILFWPRPQAAAVQLQAPPTPAAVLTAAATAPATLTPTPSPLVVFVSGAVAQPGLYMLHPTARIGDAIAAAGGLLPGVNTALVNQAQPLIDGAQLHIPVPTLPSSIPEELQTGAVLQGQTESVGDAAGATAATKVDDPPPSPPLSSPVRAQEPPAGLSVGAPPTLPTPTAMPADISAPASTSSLINVNTATSAELESLPAIGPAKAQAIIANRPYATVDELDRVPGIGPATLEQIRPHVTIQ